tara:strand:- start:492 stop:650 length:159 start_codon:yes stop_codon:yes gene_type:complete
MRRRHSERNRPKSALSEIKRLEEAIKRASDKIEKENLKQHLEHWIRTKNNSR